MKLLLFVMLILTRGCAIASVAGHHPIPARPAWVFAVSDADSLEGRVALPVAVRALCRHTRERSAPVVVLYERGSPNATALARACGDRAEGAVRLLRRQEPARVCPRMRDAYSGTFLRLESWTLVEYDVVVYVDLDVLVVDTGFEKILETDVPPGHVGAVYYHRAANAITVACKHPAASWVMGSRRCLSHHFRSHAQLMNAGVLVLRPSMDTYARLLDHYTAVGAALRGDACFHDQPLIDSFFYGSVVWIDRRFNMAPRLACLTTPHIAKPYAFHFMGPDKPWHVTTAPDPSDRLGWNPKSRCSHDIAKHFSVLYHTL